MLAAAPAEIQTAPSRAVWMVPRELRRRSSSPLKLATAEVLAKLQRITGCTLMSEGDGIAVFIGGESVEATNNAMRKLSTLAEAAVSPYKADVRCESFIYGEDQQNNPAVFTYMAHGRRSYLKSYFLDRAIHDLSEKSSAYGKIFERGVVVSLLDTDSQPAKGPGDITPAILERGRNEPYRAFAPNTWHYKAKSRLYALKDAPPNPRNNPQVTSWINRLPQPELMLHHSNGAISPELPYRTQVQLLQHTQDIPDNLQNNQSVGYNSSELPNTQELSQQTSYEHQHPTGRSNIRLVDETRHLLDSKSPHIPVVSGVGQPCNVANSAQKHPTEQNLEKPDQKEQEGLLVSFDMAETTKASPVGAQIPTNASDSEIVPEDPFAKIWNGVRKGDICVEPRAAPKTQHSTMRQKAGRRGDNILVRDLLSNHKHKAPDSDPELIQAITQKLVQMLSSLDVFTGKVYLKAELGRLCLTKVNHNHVCLEDTPFHSKAKPLQVIKEALDKHHVKPRDLVFTKILTGDGGDANYISFAEDSSGQRLWSPNTRHAIYEIHCRAKTTGGKHQDFTLEVDAKSFEYRIHELSGDSCSVFVHCPKRSWDFQVTLCKLQDLRETYNDFAEDLVNDMRVITQGSSIPLLEFIVKEAYQVKILLVRTRNVATYVRKGGNIQSALGAHGLQSPASRVLEISEVHDMAPRTVGDSNGDVTIQFQQYGGNQQLGQLPTWYEVSLQSKVINEALQQNRDLELGEKVTWTPQQLQSTGALSDLIMSATEVVKQIDGVGYWGDNFQDGLIHGEPPSGPTATSKSHYW
ncbi:uncharacterized protein F4812DRAFT_281986 [Daldinia caldariorum]|uniref:uncharacterized protein n=1 Tax=Daldinia caldariorum TaxID=326644 RepID=UPI0020075914|nr:uncharacterized protein F4812DRAFT_281986 [Daldinia caldariorum]KAI1470883.1 hypothetical protein F4812DRAFT_281986 [Daldinia caldariorum]